MNDKPLNITGRRQLMVDPRIVAESYNAFACMAEAEKHGRVIELPDKLKSSGQLHGGSILHDPQTNNVRIYYNVIDKATGLREVATAESDDGLHFEYPQLALRETASELRNNFVRVSKDVPDTDRMLHARRTDAAGGRKFVEPGQAGIETLDEILTAHLPVGHHIEAGPFLIEHGKPHRIVQRFPDVSLSQISHGFDPLQHDAQPAGHRITADELGGKQRIHPISSPPPLYQRTSTMHTGPACLPGTASQPRTRPCRASLHCPRRSHILDERIDYGRALNTP